MEQRVVGYLLTGVAALVGVIIILFNKALANIVNETCSHGSECSMWSTIRFQTGISTTLMVAILLVGLYFILFADKVRERTLAKERAAEHVHLTKAQLQKLAVDERRIATELQANDGSLFQSDLVDKTGFSKVKVTRLLDKLEGRGLVERKRRGMTNMVLLKKP